MIVSNDSVERLEEIFSSRYGHLAGAIAFERSGKSWPSTLKRSSSAAALTSKWVEFLEGHNCVVLDSEYINSDFKNIVNFDSCVRGGLCVRDPNGVDSGVEQYVIVPRDFAEKVLVMGGFPD